MVSSSGFILTLIATVFSLERWFDVSRLILCYFPFRHASVLQWHLFRCHGRTCRFQHSQFGNGIGYSSIIRILSPHWILMKCFYSPLLLWDIPGHPYNPCVQYRLEPVNMNSFFHWRFIKDILIGFGFGYKGTLPREIFLGGISGHLISPLSFDIFFFLLLVPLVLLLFLIHVSGVVFIVG